MSEHNAPLIGGEEVVPTGDVDIEEREIDEVTGDAIGDDIEWLDPVEDPDAELAQEYDSEDVDLEFEIPEPEDTDPEYDAEPPAPIPAAYDPKEFGRSEMPDPDWQPGVVEDTPDDGDDVGEEVQQGGDALVGVIPTDFTVHDVELDQSGKEGPK